MPKPKSKGAGRARRPAKGKRAAKGRRPKAKGAKPAARKGRAVAPKKKVRAPARPARQARKRKGAVPRAEAAAPKPTPPVKRKEATRMAEGQKCPIHNSPDCFKPALDAYVQQAYEGYCTKIEWPFVRIIPKGWKPGK